MIDLRKEIELKKINIENYHNEKYAEGFIDGVNEALEVIDRYDIGELSDGYHTFNSLYEQRMYLFATIVNQNKDKAWKSYKHEDGELCFGGGWFIVGIDTPNGSYTYHYENKYYDLFECEELECGKHWDGHNDKDVDRVLSLANYNIITAPKTIKLSEIIDKIYDTEYSGECYVHAIKCDNGHHKNDYRIRVQYGVGFWGDFEFYIVDGKISSNYDMDLPRDEFKWLYTLWIAGTIIEDDLKEE